MPNNSIDEDIYSIADFPSMVDGVINLPNSAIYHIHNPIDLSGHVIEGLNNLFITHYSGPVFISADREKVDIFNSSTMSIEEYLKYEVAH